MSKKQCEHEPIPVVQMGEYGSTVDTGYVWCQNCGGLRNTDGDPRGTRPWVLPRKPVESATAGKE